MTLGRDVASTLRGVSASFSGVAALLLAAGAGRRLGVPKALMHDADGVPWVERTARRLVHAGCAPVVVVVGARAAEAAALVPPRLVPPADVIEAAGWSEGMGASLRAGRTVAARHASACGSLTRHRRERIRAYS